MRTERMTKKELEELLKTNNAVRLVCDSGEFVGRWSNIDVLRVQRNEMSIVDVNGLLAIMSVEALKSYPSQKPQDEIVEFKAYMSMSGAVYYLDEAHRAYDYQAKKMVSKEYLSAISIPTLPSIKINITTGEVVK